MYERVKILLLSCGLLLFAGSAAIADNIRVFAAASLKDALEDIAQIYDADQSNIVFSFGSSAAMARQVSLGAPADIIISANRQWMNKLEQSGHINGSSQTLLLGNSLVVVSSGTDSAIDDWTALDQVFSGGRIAVAQVDAVPAGIYAKEALSSLGVWDTIETQLVQADNVRSALAFAATGAVPYAVVYQSDAIADARVNILGVFPEETHSPIQYPAALVTGRERPETEKFLAFLTNPEARAVFHDHGFQTNVMAR